ncbi:MULTISPECIES: hypothetical protein [unclassified Phyllobacterium]|uniref:hypothetical protein n=1 Tax=unclassified Phyllobacterium TaxID=2638441 RepID=UPI003012DC95
MITSAVAVANSKPISDLLGPSAKTLGLFLGKKTQAWVDGREASRAQNARTHLDKVREIEHLKDPNPSPTERQAALLVEWAEQAQTVDPDQEDDLASLWQATLAGIYRNDVYAEEMIITLKQLNRLQAKLLLETPSGWFRPTAFDDFNLLKFKSLGLVSPYSWTRSHDKLQLLWILAGCFVAFAMFYIVPTLYETSSGETRNFPELQMARLTGVLAGSAVVFTLAYFALQRLGTYCLTRVGRNLRDQGRKYWKTGVPSK